MTVAEAWPGAGGWYTEILAPVLAGGRLYAAQMAAEPGNPYVTAVRDAFTRKLATRPEVYANVVDLYVSYLRKKLDRDGGASHIRTVRGVGYTFEPQPR